MRISLRSRGMGIIVMIGLVVAMIVFARSCW